MDISAANPYRHLARYRQPVTIRPVERPDAAPPDTDKPSLTPEHPDKIKNAHDTQREELRRLTAGYVGLQSKKSRREIHMSGLSGADMRGDAPDGVEFYEALREIRRQNNRIQAYAAYGQNRAKTS